MILLFIISSCQNPISETGYSTTDLNHPEFSYAGAKGTTGSVRNPMSVSPTSFNNNGFIPTCTIVPALPPGLSIHPSNCVISGTPVNVLSKTTYTITAQNIAGLTRENVVLNVVPSKPTISYTLGVGLVNQAFTHNPTLYHNDSPITACTITPALPDGFSIDPLTCVVTGESDEFINSQTHSVTVTNGVGSTTTNMTFLIAGPPILSYFGVSTSGSVANAMSITPSVLEFQGAGLTSCTTSPALPDGLEINNETCVISGTPTVTDSRSYTVTATNPAGSSTESLSLNIVPSPPAISFSGVLGLGFVAIPFLASPSLLDDNRALITSCQSTTTLPTGLSINPNTCVISGTPSGVSSSNPYTIRATNSAGYTDASFLISISPSAPTISYSGVSGSAVYNSSFTMAPGILNLNGASIDSCTISPALPSGFSIHNSTCTISGSPSELSPLTTYTVTVQNSAGSSTGTLSLSVTGGSLSFTEDGVPQTVPIHLPGGVAGASCSPLSFSGNSLVTTTISGIHPDCLASIQPNSNQNGSGTLTLSFNNISSPSTTLGFSIASVDDAPVSSALSQVIDEDVTTLVTLNYSDVEGHLATTCALSNLTNLTGTCSCSSGVCQASIRGTSNYFGSGSFTYTVNANGVNSNSSLASIAINSIDDAPVVSNVSGTLIEDTQGTVNLSYTDVESHEATTCTLSSLSNLTGTCACTSGACTATLTGASNFNGSASFSYTITANGVISNSASATITISLVNDAPVLTAVSNQSTNEDTPASITLSVTEVDEVINCSNFLSVTSSNTTLLPNASIAKSGTAPGCVLTLTPALNQFGITTVTVVASDGTLSDTKSFTLTVSAANDAPTISSIGTQTTNEDTTKVVTFTISDVDSSLDCSSFVSVTSSSPVSSVTKGGTAPNCTLTVVPIANLNGSSTIGVTVTDGYLPISTSFAFNVTPVDDAPVASNISETISEDVASSITLSYTDADSDKASTCALSSLSNLTGTCACNATTGVCTATVTGTSNYNGSASFSYTVTANSVVSNSASASVTITAVNDAPVLAAISAQSTTENIAKSVTLSVSDVDNAITCTSFVSATSSNTTLLPNANIISGGSAPGCTLTLTPVTAQTGSAIITVTATDGLLPSVQTFTLTVNPNIVTITQYATYRGWSNQTFARTCYEYRYPTVPYQYSGATGDSTATASTFYRIDPDGSGPIEPLNVSCDMTNGGWTSLSALSTATTGYTRNETRTSTDLVTSNSAAYTAIANLSTKQMVSYSVNFNGDIKSYSCPYGNGESRLSTGCIIILPDGSYDGLYDNITAVSESGPKPYPFRCEVVAVYPWEGEEIPVSYSYRAQSNWQTCNLGGNDLIVSQVDYCTLTVRFLNSGSTVLHTPVTAGVTLNTSSSSAFDLSGSGGVRKIETQTTCTGSGGTPSNGVKFSSATVKFKSGVALPAVSLSSFFTLKASFVNCGQYQQPFSAKVEDCTQVNNGATVDVGSGKIWKLVTKIGGTELWMDDATGIVWTYQHNFKNLGHAMGLCSSLHTTAPNSNYGIDTETWWLPSKSQIDVGISNGVTNFITQTGNGWWSSTTISYPANYAWLRRFTSTGWWSQQSYYSESGVPCVFSSRD